MQWLLADGELGLPAQDAIDQCRVSPVDQERKQLQQLSVETLEILAADALMEVELEALLVLHVPQPSRVPRQRIGVGEARIETPLSDGNQSPVRGRLRRDQLPIQPFFTVNIGWEQRL
ncbi:MAG TPA: hypothetical protein VHT91_24740 [Kofleriaceae bacterium]|jgi:hypothetical protein|nr:hypothetical protein [Kofleriaceae bacterium]